VVKFDDGLLAITSGSRAPVGVELSKRGFKTPDEFAAENAAAAKLEAERKRNAGIRIWHDTRMNVVRTGASGSWSVSCQDDRIDDLRRCLVHPYGLSKLVVGAGKDGPVLVIGGDDNYPGSEISIRIDTAAAVRWTEGTLTIDRLRSQREAIAQMLTGRTYLARSFGWPHRDARMIEGSLDGFKEAYEWAQSAAKAYPAPATMPTFKLNLSETPGGQPLQP